MVLGGRWSGDHREAAVSSLSGQRGAVLDELFAGSYELVSWRRVWKGRNEELMVLGSQGRTHERCAVYGDEPRRCCFLAVAFKDDWRARRWSFASEASPRYRVRIRRSLVHRHGPPPGLGADSVCW